MESHYYPSAFRRCDSFKRKAAKRSSELMLPHYERACLIQLVYRLENLM